MSAPKPLELFILLSDYHTLILPSRLTILFIRTRLLYARSTSPVNPSDIFEISRQETDSGVPGQSGPLSSSMEIHSGGVLEGRNRGHGVRKRKDRRIRINVSMIPNSAQRISSPTTNGSDRVFENVDRSTSLIRPLSSPRQLLGGNVEGISCGNKPMGDTSRRIMIGLLR